MRFSSVGFPQPARADYCGKSSFDPRPFGSTIRPLTKENTPEPNPYRTPSRESGSSGLERVREAARKDRKLKFTALLHHVSIDLLRESYYSLKKKAAPGVDGMTWQEYGEDLEARLSDLHGRIHRGAYRAQPSRRVWIPKAHGRQRRAIVVPTATSAETRLGAFLTTPHSLLPNVP
jgi:hypothetical protein